MRLSSTAPRMPLHQDPKPPDSRRYKPICGCSQYLTKTSSPFTARSSAHYEGSPLALRFASGWRKEPSVRPPLRSDLSPGTFRHPSTSLRPRGKPPPLCLRDFPVLRGFPPSAAPRPPPRVRSAPHPLLMDATSE